MSKLAHREIQVLLCLKQGLRMQAIAHQLAISYHTVDSHLRNVYHKLNVQTNIQAVVKAMEKNLI
jgi:two-component system nitrate/nitrite response regulator NarL